MTRLPRLLFLLLLAMPAHAETVQVKSGEHDTFSRLVLELETPTGWQLGRGKDGYELRLARSDILLDLTRVFQFIPRARILDVAVLADSALLVRVSPGTYATAFEIRPGAIVLDVVSGAAATDSRFEAPFVSEAPAAPAPNLAATATPPSFPVTANPTSDARLGYYWTGVTISHPGAPATTEPPAGALRQIGADPRVQEAEQQLLLQLGRAASQGLVTMELPDAPAAELASATPEPPVTSPATEVTTEVLVPQDHLAVRSQTVFDRDDASGQAALPLNPEGLVCLSDAAFNVAEWASGAPAAIQIGAAQTGLLGEFDKPEPERVLTLAHLYVSLGLGTEVAALFDGLRIEPPDADVLRAMASVIEDRPVPHDNRLAQMAGCDANAAFWAVMANPTLGPADVVDLNAVLRGFSALPLNLRRLLGPRLADHLRALGAEWAARAVRDAIARAPGEHGASTGLIDAGIESAAGRPTAASAALAPMIAENGPDAPRAMVLYIDSVLASGAAIDLPTIEAVAALAFEHREAPDGPNLARAHVLAAGSAGLFQRAFDALSDLSTHAAPEFVAGTTTALIHQLAATPDDLIFATQYFNNRTLVLLQSDWPLQVQTAQRLLDLGFSAEARRVLGPQAVRHESGRLLRARAAVQDGNGAAALVEITGISGDEAALLRADALRLSGDHDAARRAYLLAEVQDMAATEAWRGGAWAEAASLGTTSQRDLLAALGVVAAPITDLETAGEIGPLAASRALLAQSRAARGALGALLAETAAD